jgi:glycerate 2-kinase
VFLTKGTLASIGTDGIDGNSPYAGALADGYTLEKAEENDLDIDEFLKNNDSSSFFEKVGGAIKTGYTGTNVADIVVVLKE